MWSRAQRFHFIGIGGIGVSAVARVLHQQGVAVQGSDVRESQLTLALRALGIPVTIGHRPENVAGADVVVHSTAVPHDNLERVAARDRGLPEAHRSEMLDLCLEGAESVGVTGTHGKGTVSAMITHGLIVAGRDPTFVIGGLLNNYKTNARAGRGGVAVAEVDESDRSHLNLEPTHVVVNNLEVDHLNFYKDLDDIVGTMAKFINENKRLKVLALNWDDAGVRAMAAQVTRPYVRYGTTAEVDFSARDVEDLGDRVRFQAYARGERLGDVTLHVPGAYNADNAAGAIAVLMGAFDLPFVTVKQALESYQGLENRFTVRRAGGVTLVKDYISHPTGMRRVLESARKIPHRRIWGVFKPYRFTLMRYHGDEYAQVFRGADEVVITTMYAAEERPMDGIDTPWFVNLLREGGNVVHYVPENPDVVPFLRQHVHPGDMVIFFGGDDFFRMADAWADALEAAPHAGVPRRPEDWAGVRVAVWGAARSGIAAANLLADLGASVVLSDARAREAVDLAGLDPRVEFEGGGNVLAGASIVVPSPGIPPAATVFLQARTAGVKLCGEVELAAGLARAPVVAITGTDGKSTTTEMIGAVVRGAGRPAVVAGNIGVPLSQEVRSVGPEGVVVAEISAFQLWSCGYFRPRVAVVTNVAPDHTDYFAGDWDAYVAAKARVLGDQGPGDVAVLRGDDPVVSAMATRPGVTRVLFGLRPEYEWGFDGTHLLRRGEAVMAAGELRVEGRHNVCNALATLAAGEALGLPLEAMRAALRDFQGLPHRMERIRVRRGVTFIDDSKATNPHAARVGLRSLEVPYVAIVGGFDKGLDQAELVGELVARARAVVVIGGTAARTAAEIAGRVEVAVAHDMAEAVALAAAHARDGDAVVLSPAASSFDLYRDYHHRGQVFQAAVRALED